MNRTLVTFCIVVVTGAFVAGAYAQETVAWIGAALSHRSFERYDLSVGVTAGQLPRRPMRIEEDREVLNVPGHYGTLVDITAHGNSAVFWYRDASGSLRNSVVVDPATRLLEIQTTPSSRYESDARELPR